MRTNPPKTPLLALLRMLTADQKKQLAANAGTSVSYLYQLATCARKQPKVQLALNLENATRIMRAETRKTPVITATELGRMCLLADNS